jgi:DNA-binding MarR family transcriptional regulator
VNAWLRLLRVSGRIERAAAGHLRQWGLTVPQFDVLAHVGAREGATQADIARSRLTTKGNLSQLLDTMEAAGLLTRSRDGRANRIWLTVRGRELLAEITPSHEALIARRFETLDAEQLARLRAQLRQLDRALARQDAMAAC